MMETHDENDVRRYPERGSLNHRQINARAAWQGAGWEMNENEVEEIPQTGFRQPIGHFQVPPEPLYQNEVKC